MAKIILPEISSGYLSVDKLNEALEAIAEALENTLSRDGTTPNTMEADLDLNGHSIINSGGESSDPERLMTYAEALALVQANASGLIIVQTERQVATASQTDFTLDTISYEPGTSNLAVYVNGVRKFADYDYTEVDGDQLTFLVGMGAGDEVDFVSSEYTATVSVEAHTHPWSQLTNVPSYASRWPTYDEVTGKPATFTPSSHNHAASEITSGRLADARRGVHVQSAEPTATTVGELWIW